MAANKPHLGLRRGDGQLVSPGRRSSADHGEKKNESRSELTIDILKVAISCRTDARCGVANGRSRFGELIQIKVDSQRAERKPCKCPDEAAR